MKSQLDIEHVWDQYRSALQAFVRSRVSGRADADDVLQEILIKTYEKLPTLLSEQSVKAWVFQIANRTIIDFFRKHGRRKTEPIGDDIPDEQAQRIARDDLTRCVEPFVNALSAESKELLTVIDLLGMPQKDYAQKIGVPYSTLKSRVQKSRLELREMFERCCHFSMGPRGDIVDYRARSESCGNC